MVLSTKQEDGSYLCRGRDQFRYGTVHNAWYVSSCPFAIWEIPPLSGHAAQLTHVARINSDIHIMMVALASETACQRYPIEDTATIDAERSARTQYEFSNISGYFNNSSPYWTWGVLSNILHTLPAFAFSAQYAVLWVFSYPGMAGPG